MLAHGPEELDQLGIPGVEADPHAGQVRALGERVHGDHAVGTVLQHRPRRAVPGELGVALVGEQGNAVRPPPGGLRPEVAQAPGRVRRRVRPQQQGAPGVLGIDGVELQPSEPAPGGRNRDGAAAGQLRPHGVGRIGHGGKQHRVAPRLAQPEQVRHRGHELLGPHAGGDRRRRDVGSAKRRASHPAAASRSCGLPAEAG